tara:strand:+ start:5742 stop:6893 length:1152 start_codon:yes stop_codon:yes gene_type:complete
MSTDDKKINVDDITFDDMLDGGIEDSQESIDAEEEEVIENEQSQENSDQTSLEDDIEAKQDEGQKHEEVLAEAEIPEEPTGNLTKKTAETAEEETQAVDETVVGQVLSSLGYETDEEAEKYEDTAEGLTQMTKDVGSQIAEEQLDRLFEQYPLVGQHLSYVMNGGQSQDFMTVNDPQSDYSKMKLSEKDLRGQKYILSEYFRAKGHDDKFTNEILGDYQDGGRLFNKAQSAQQELVQMQNQYKQQMVQQQQQQQQEQDKEQEKFWNGVYDTIDQSKEFQGIQIPDREKSKFFDYLSQPVTKEGYTQRDVDYGEAEMDVKLAMDFLMYKGFNLEKLINTKARTKSTQSLKDRITKHQETVKSARKVSKAPSKAVDIDDLDLSLF